MCFKNLPIEFDAQGRAHLKEGVANPYAYVANGHPLEREERIKELLAGTPAALAPARWRGTSRPSSPRYIRGPAARGATSRKSTVTTVLRSAR